MASESRSNTVKTHDEILARIRGLTTGIRDGAAAAEEARTVPRETIDALLSAGITRILVPPRFGGYGLGLETWFEVVREIGKADASHAWCASLMIHHPHYISQFAEDAQRAVWAGGLDIAIAASILPSARVTPVDGGYRISGQFPFASRECRSPETSSSKIILSATPVSSFKPSIAAKVSRILCLLSGETLGTAWEAREAGPLSVHRQKLYRRNWGKSWLVT